MLLSKHVAFLQNKDVLRSSAARFFSFWLWLRVEFFYNFARFLPNFLKEKFF